MILLVDAGNSRLKWALCSEGRISAQAVIAVPPGDAGAVWESAWLALTRPDAVHVVCVRNAAFHEALRAWIEQHWGLSPVFVVSQPSGQGVENAYSRPESLGADRWAALVAARHQFDGGVCIVDCGTALTVDVLTADGRHRGGLIVPGLTTMRRSLATSTDGIELATEPSEVALLARDTVGGVQGGTLYALVAFVERIAGDVESALGGTFTLVLTGGDATEIGALLGCRYVHEPDLVLRGAAVMAGAM